MTAPAVAVLHAPGTNRDGDALVALERAGAAPAVVPVGRELGGYQAVVVPGGFSYGDALGAGARLALEVAEPLAAFAAEGRPVLGICNGFQALVRAGLLPGPAVASGCPDRGRPVTLTHNANGRFECRWVHLALEPGASAGLADDVPAMVACPVAHGEGRLAVAGEQTVDGLARDGQILFRYVDTEGRPVEGRYPENPNGSVGDIAGLCNAAGNVWGLMPHPEDHLGPEQDPFHRPGRSGLPLFQALVRRARAH